LANEAKSLIWGGGTGADDGIMEPPGIGAALLASKDVIGFRAVFGLSLHC
jgi:hypothetical protein